MTRIALITLINAVVIPSATLAQPRKRGRKKQVPFKAPSFERQRQAGRRVPNITNILRSNIISIGGEERNVVYCVCKYRAI
jgi:hypothetical protein